jgi:hypothetical protein
MVLKSTASPKKMHFQSPLNGDWALWASTRGQIFSRIYDMGSVYQAYCNCGYRNDVTVGGSRSTFLEQSSFPFHCGQCGLVSVNIALLPRGQVVTDCPVCKAPGCTQYGIPPVSLHDLRPTPWWKRLLMLSKKEAPPATNLQWGNREASEDGHKCPKCHEMQLRFSRVPSLMFD